MSLSRQRKRRSPAVAALLSIPLMGLGQLYNGQLDRAALFFAVALLFTLGAAFGAGLFLSFEGLILLYLGVALYLGIKVFAIADAFVSARRLGVVVLHGFQRWYVYLSAIVIALAAGIFLEPPTESYWMPAGSMQPTLIVGDHITADRKAYEVRAPERGDVAVFRLPLDNQTEYLKRVVGLPGDRIQMVDGRLHINDQAVPRELIVSREITGFDGRIAEIQEFKETLPNGRSYRIWEQGDKEVLDDTQVYVVPADHYFALGDNRDLSQDSRAISGVGYIPRENFIGRAAIIHFSENGSAAWWQIWLWPRAIRFERIGQEIK